MERRRASVGGSDDDAAPPDVVPAEYRADDPRFDEDVYQLYDVHYDGGEGGGVGDVVVGDNGGAAPVDAVALMNDIMSTDALDATGVAWDDDAVAAMLLEEEAHELVDSVAGGGAAIADGADGGHGGGGGGEDDVPERQTVDDLVAHRFDPIFPGARITVIQVRVWGGRSRAGGAGARHSVSAARRCLWVHQYVEMTGLAQSLPFPPPPCHSTYTPHTWGRP